MTTLRASGRARFIFHQQADPVRFEGVLIHKDTGESYWIIGRVNDDIGKDDSVVDVHITDGETGECHVISGVQLKAGESANNSNEHHHSSNKKYHNRRRVSASFPGLKNIETTTTPAPRYELVKPEVLHFATKQVLVGRRADEEIASYMRADLLGGGKQQDALQVLHTGHMDIAYIGAEKLATPSALAAASNVQMSSSNNGAAGAEGGSNTSSSPSSNPRLSSRRVWRHINSSSSPGESRKRGVSAADYTNPEIEVNYIM